MIEYKKRLVEKKRLEKKRLGRREKDEPATESRLDRNAS
jgi:hypothetical protein